MSSVNACTNLDGHFTVAPDTIKNLKAGDKFAYQPDINKPIQFKVLGADIVHHQHVNSRLGKSNNLSASLTLATNYPFGRRLGDTPLRYVIYAALVA